MNSFLENYSSMCKIHIEDFNKLKPNFQRLPLPNQTPYWMVKGNIGPFQWRSLGAYYPNTEGDPMKEKYNEKYRELIMGGCIQTAQIMMSSLQYDPEFGELYNDDNQLNNIIANTQVFRQGMHDYVVLNECQLTLQQIGTIIDDDVFRANLIEQNGIKGYNVEINTKAIKDCNVILPYLYAETADLRAYAQMAEHLMRGGAKSVVALYILQIMPDSFGREILGKVDLPMPRGGGYSFNELVDMF